MSLEDIVETSQNPFTLQGIQHCYCYDELVCLQ